MEKLRVLIADDHPLLVQGLRAIVGKTDDINIIGEARHGDDAQRLCRELLPDVLLLGLQMPGASASETIQYVHEYCPTTRIVILTAYDDDIYVHRMMALGVEGYVLKDEIADIVNIAIHTVIQGGSWFSRSVMEKLVQRPFSAPSQFEGPHLTKREQQLLHAIACGWNNVRIANELNITERTVRNYVSQLYDKLAVDSRAELIVLVNDRQKDDPRDTKA